MRGMTLIGVLRDLVLSGKLRLVEEGRLRQRIVAVFYSSLKVMRM